MSRPVSLFENDLLIQDNAMDRILVTGGCGFIASNFTRPARNSRGDCRPVNLDKLICAGNLQQAEHY